MGGHLQLLLIALCVIALYLVARIISNKPNSPDNEMRAQSQAFVPKFSLATFAKDYRSAPISDNLGRVRVSQFNFAHFDAMPGPPDPESFADELILELYDSVSDFRWTVTYVVATPSGIRKLMDDERWSFFHATEIFIVRRYDLQLIREAVYGRIKEIHDEVPLDPEVPPIRG